MRFNLLFRSVKQLLINLIYWNVVNNLWNFNDWLVFSDWLYFSDCLFYTRLNLKGVMNNKQSITRSGRLRPCMSNIRNYVSKLMALTDQVIFKKFSISWFHNPSVVRWIIKSVPLRLFNISNEIPSYSPWVQLFLLWIINSHFRRAFSNAHMSQTLFPTFP